jgi:hypothetical protein
MASVLVLSRCPLLLLFLLATDSQALNVGNLLGTPPAVRTRGRRAESEFSEVVFEQPMDWFVGLLFSAGGAGLQPDMRIRVLHGWGRHNPFLFQSFIGKSRHVLLLLHVLVLCSLHLVFLWG